MRAMGFTQTEKRITHGSSSKDLFYFLVSTSYSLLDTHANKDLCHRVMKMEKSKSLLLRTLLYPTVSSRLSPALIQPPRYYQARSIVSFATPKCTNAYKRRLISFTLLERIRWTPSIYRRCTTYPQSCESSMPSVVV